MDKNKFVKLKEFLPPGAILKTSKKFQKDPSYVSRVGTGKIKNPIVLEHLIAIAEKYKNLLVRIDEL